MAGAYYVGTRKHSLSNVIMSVIFIIIVSSITAIAAGYLLWEIQPEFISKVSFKGFVISIAYVPSLLLFTSIWYVHSAMGHIRVFCIGEIISAGVILLGVLTLCLSTHMPEYAMLSSVLGLLSGGSFLLVSLAKKNKIKILDVSWGCIKDLYFYGIKYYFGRLAEFFNVQIGTIVIIFLGCTADIGYFATAIGLTSRLDFVPGVFNAVLLSRIVKDQQGSLETTAKSIRWTFWLVLFIGIILALLCKPLVMIIFSSKFLPIVIPIWILLPGMLVKCCSKILGIYFNGIGQPGINSVALIVAIFINAVLMYFLLPIYGIIGAAVALTCGYIFNAMILTLYYKFVLKHPLHLMVPRISDIIELFAIIHMRFCLLCSKKFN